MKRRQIPTRTSLAGSACVAAILLAGCVERRAIPAQPLPAAPVAETTASGTPPVRALRIGGPAGPSASGFVRYGDDPDPLRDALGRAPLPAALVNDTRPVSLNLADVPVEALADKVLGDVLGAAYVIEQPFDDVASLRTPQPTTRAEVLRLFEQILAARGAALIWTGEAFRIVAAEPDGPALRTAPLDGGGLAAGIGYATRAIRLRHAVPSALAEIIRPVAADGAVRTFDDARGILVLAGSQAELAELVRLVALFDVDWLEGMSVGLLPLRHASPAAVAEELLLTLAPDTDATARATRIVPVERARALLVVTPSAAMLRTVQQLLPHLDYAAGDDRALYVYPVQNRSAAELAQLVTAVFEGGGATGGPALPAAAGPADGPAAIPAVFTPGAAAPGRGVRGAPPVTAVADEQGNALILRADPAVYDAAIAVIERLDAVPSQVLLEVTIAEVTLGDELRYGIEYALKFGDFQAQFADNILGIVGPQPPGLSLLLSGGNGAVVLNALAGATDVNIVSSPSLMVVDNGTASLQVGDQVPIITQSAVDVSDPTAPIVNSVSYRDTGVTLSVTPRVSDNGLVLLEIEQDVSDVVPTTTSGIDSPTIRQRRIATSVAVSDGESLVLGGLIRDGRRESVRGVPLLMDIPVAGELFRTTEDTVERTELLVLITPRVVRNRADARAVTAELRGRLVALRPDFGS